MNIVIVNEDISIVTFFSNTEPSIIIFSISPFNNSIDSLPTLRV
jgi:hypothetical protein